MSEPVEVPEQVMLKALSEGQAGETWLAGLAGAVSDLAREWGLSIGRTLSGGTEALVVEAAMPDGRGAVLKVGRPGRGTTAGELRTLLAAQGRGYAEVYRYERAREAVLLERLGAPIAEAGLSTDAQMRAVFEALEEAWSQAPDDGVGLMTGADKARSLANFIQETWSALGRPCSERTIETALRYAEARRQSFDPRSAVLAHGDPHPWNALLAPGGARERCRFVDPEGLVIERAYDLGILMREWTSELLSGDPLALGHRRCHRLAGLSGVDPEPIWQWGLVERTSTGLLCMKVGLGGAREMLDVADAWASAAPPRGGRFRGCPEARDPTGLAPPRVDRCGTPRRS